MKRLLFLSLAFAFAFLFVACDSGNTGDFKITLRLPIEQDDESDDNTFSIVDSDQVMLSIYSKSSIADEYVYADRALIKVNSDKGGKQEFIRSLKKGAYYRFFVEVTNSNEKLKLTGGIDGILYDDKNNYEVSIFLTPVGDFARVVSDRSHSDKSSLESYISEDGSKGSAAVALKDGRIYMAGGFDLEEEEISKKAVVFNTKEIARKDVKNLQIPLYDHIAALLDDGSETGKVVVGLGTTEEDALNESVWVYDPKSDKYDSIPVGAQPMTKAKAITIDGDVYIVGGCTDSAASNVVYKVSAKSGNVVSEQFATLKQGRCNHAVADVSIVKVDENGVKTVTPRILVIGGSVDKKEGKETPVLGDNFAELVTQGASTPMAVADRNGGDDADLKTKGLISPAAVSILMDDREEEETVVAVLGGYLRDGEEDNFSWIQSPSLFVFSESAINEAAEENASEEGDGENEGEGEGKKAESKKGLVYDKNGTANECSRPSAALLGSEEKNVIKYVAVNCGTKEIDRVKKNATGQVVFVLQVKRVKDSDLGIEVFSSSVKDSLMDENQDPDSDAQILDGPVAADALGQVFMLGGQYVYQVGSYAVP